MSRGERHPARWQRVITSLPARVAITAALLAVLATQIDWPAVEDRVRSGDPGWLAAAVVVLSTALVAGALRWHMLLGAAGVRVRFGGTLRGYYIGAFANNFLPTGFGGDVVRAIAVAGRGPELAPTATTVLVDRLTALACLVALGWIALPLDPRAVPAELLAALGALTAAGLVGALILRVSLGSARLRRLIPERVRPTLAEMRRPLARYSGDRALAAWVVALGLLYQALVVLAVCLAARAVQLELPYVLVAVTVPIVLVLTLLPVTVAGFGLREGSFAVLLGTAGYSAAEGTLVSLVTVVTMALASLPGALGILRSRVPAG